MEPVGANGEILWITPSMMRLQQVFVKLFLSSTRYRTGFSRSYRRTEKETAHLGVSFHYAFQELDDLPAGYSLPQEGASRGTGQAVLCCKEILDGPFAVINADDYYGKQAFRNLYDFLEENEDESANSVWLALY